MHLQKRSLRNRFCPRLEQLEDRLVPANVGVANGILTINGIIHGAIAVNQQPNGTWNVKEGAVNQGTFAASSIMIDTTNSVVAGGNDTITVNLDPANVLPGNLTIYSGAGNDTITIDTNAAPTTGGRINGYVNINTGTGTDTVNVGTANGVTIRGFLNDCGGAGTDALNIGNGVNSTSVLGNVLGSSVETVSVGVTGATTTIGALIISNTGDVASGSFTLNATSTVLQGLTIVGGVNSDVATLSGTVDGASSVLLGEGANTLVTNSSAQFFGNFTFSGGSSADLVQLHAATFAQNLQLNMGGGNNNYTVSSNFIVGNNMTLTAGDGDNNVGAFAGKVAGSLTVTFGGGNNIFNFNGTGGATVGGKITYTSGNGNNTFEISTGGHIVTLNVTFGTGNDTFTIDSAADEANLTGFLDWGDVVFANDTFNEPVGGAFILPWQFKNTQ